LEGLSEYTILPKAFEGLGLWAQGSGCEKHNKISKDIEVVAFERLKLKG